jgi:hypothetical protein
MTWKYMGACGGTISLLLFFFRWLLQLSSTTFFFPNAFSLSFSLVISLTFYLPLALPIFFNFSLPFDLATTKAFSLALPTFLGAACELQRDLLLLVEGRILLKMFY